MSNRYVFSKLQNIFVFTGNDVHRTYTAGICAMKKIHLTKEQIKMKSRLNRTDLILIIMMMVSEMENPKKSGIAREITDEYKGCFSPKTIDGTMEHMTDYVFRCHIKEVFEKAGSLVFTRKLEIIINNLVVTSSESELKKIFSDDEIIRLRAVNSETNIDNLRKTRGKVVKKYETLEQTHYILRYMTAPGSRNCIASELDIAGIVYDELHEPISDKTERELKKEYLPAVANVEVKCVRGKTTEITLTGLGRKRIFQVLSGDMVSKLIRIQRLVYTGESDENGDVSDEMLERLRVAVDEYD